MGRCMFPSSKDCIPRSEEIQILKLLHSRQLVADPVFQADEFPQVARLGALLNRDGESGGVRRWVWRCRCPRVELQPCFPRWGTAGPPANDSGPWAVLMQTFFHLSGSGLGEAYVWLHDD